MKTAVCNASYTVCAVQLQLCCQDLSTALALAGAASSLQPPHACLRCSASSHAPCYDAVIPSHALCHPSSCSARDFRQMEGPASGTRDYFGYGTCPSQHPRCCSIVLSTQHPSFRKCCALLLIYSKTLKGWGSSWHKILVQNFDYFVLERKQLSCLQLITSSRTQIATQSQHKCFDEPAAG